MAKTSSKKNKGGRPTVMTDKTIKKLERAFISGLSDRKACIFAGISTQALYDYCGKHPEFAERKELLKRTPSIDAQITMAKAVKSDPKYALKYLERKERREWAPPTVKTENANTTVPWGEWIKQIEREEGGE